MPPNHTTYDSVNAALWSLLYFCALSLAPFPAELMICRCLVCSVFRQRGSTRQSSSLRGTHLTAGKWGKSNNNTTHEATLTWSQVLEFKVNNGTGKYLKLGTRARAVWP